MSDYGSQQIRSKPDRVDLMVRLGRAQEKVEELKRQLRAAEQEVLDVENQLNQVFGRP